MTLRTKKRLLAAAAAALCVAAASMLLWGFGSAPDFPENPYASAAGSASSVELSERPKNEPLLTVADLQPYWERPLRKPLYDPPPPPPVPIEKPPPRPITAKLLATMIEPANTVAMLQLGNGEIVFRKPGEAIGEGDDDALIDEIKPGSVTIRRGEEETVLSVN